jgi:L-asparaginase
MKPTVAVFAMGGTIAMGGQGARGVKPSLDAAMLVDAVPQLAEVATIEAETFRLLPSPEITIPDLLELATTIEQVVADGAVGVVVTHGTDTMEETAFVLDRLLTIDAPVVVTGAMRNPTMAGPDGPANLLNAVRIAVHEPARGLGVLVTMNDEIHAARYVQKANTSSTAAFRSVPAGPLGWLAEGTPRLTGRLASRRTVAVSRDAEIPAVALLTATLGDDGRLIDQALGAGYAGIVFEATGGGHAAGWVADRLAAASERVPVIYASRTGSGEMLRQTYDFKGSETDFLARGLINGGWLDGLKSRLLLTLLLAAGTDGDEVRDTFAAWLDPIGT